MTGKKRQVRALSAQSSARRSSLALRIVYLALIAVVLARGDWGGGVFHGIIFIGSLFVIWMARRERSGAYYALDALTCAIFSAAIIISFFGLWSDTEYYLGLDKLFHASAGVVLAWFAIIYLRRHSASRTVVYAGAVVFALAVGGAWEVFEWLFHILPQPLHLGSMGYTDSMMDLVADTVGASLITLVFWSRAKKR